MRKKLITFLLCCCLIAGNTVYANNMSMTASSQATSMNDTIVRVVKHIGNEQIVVYTGPISQYENGLCASVDFVNNSLAVFFVWDEVDAVYYIYPIEITDDNGEETEDYLNIGTMDNVRIENENEVMNALNSANNNTNIVEYDIAYNIVSDDDLYIDATYSIYNSSQDMASVSIIAALYDDGRLCDIKTKSLSVNNEIADILTLTLPDEREQCYVKLMVWDDIEGIQPLGEPKCVVDLDVYNREKYLYVNEGNGSEFNLFMRQSMVKGDNNGAIHSIEYDSRKMEPIDLCGLTYDKEMSVGEIPNTGITIKNVDLNEGNIQYSFDMVEGRNTGVINYIKFKAIAELNSEPINYTIQ